MRLNRWEMLCMNNPPRKFLMRFVELVRFQTLLAESGIDLSGKRILDVACGSGYSTRLLKQTFSPCHLAAFDLMDEQVALAKKEPADLLFQGDLINLALEDASFDAAFGFGILHHVLDWRSAAAEIVRILPPGGVLLLEEPHGPAGQFFRKWVRFAIPREGAFSFEELKKEMDRLGMELLGQKTIWFAPFQAFLWQKRF